MAVKENYNGCTITDTAITTRYTLHRRRTTKADFKLNCTKIKTFQL